MTTTLCPAVWGGKNRIIKDTATAGWFHLYVTENDSNHGPTNDVCVILTTKQLEFLRGSIIQALAGATEETPADEVGLFSEVPEDTGEKS